MNKDLKLVYVHEFGESWDGDFVYQFLFASKIDNIDGDNWDAMPASGKPTPPPDQYIELVGELRSEYLFEVLQNSNTRRMWDGVDGSTALAIEDITDYDEYPDKRLFFHYGNTKEHVENVLFQNNLILKYHKTNES